MGELKATEGWMWLTAELGRILDTTERTILDAPIGDGSANACRYTRYDLLREVRRTIKNFLELPDDVLERIKASVQEADTEIQERKEDPFFV